MFQGVHMILDGDHQRPWKDGEKRDSRIVFIGRNLPEEKIRQGLRELHGVIASESVACHESAPVERDHAIARCSG